MADALIHTAYDLVKQACSVDWKAPLAGNAILDLVEVSLRFLQAEGTAVDLISKVPGKEYFTYKKGNILARPVNKRLFLADGTTIRRLWNSWLAEQIGASDFATLSYTAALAPCLAMELFDRQNKKGPATYFECFIGHLFSKSIGVNPTRRATLPVAGQAVRMTMDFLFDLGPNHRKVHLPVKMSTRERVVQAWSHQRLLDAAYGEGIYRGIMVLFSETKLDSRTLQVVEICVPDQWLAYQSLLSRMDRIYYLDAPQRYLTLSAQFPSLLVVKPFGDFFTERETVLHS